MLCLRNDAQCVSMTGVRILDGPMTDSLEAMAFNSKMHVNDIYSCRLVSKAVDFCSQRVLLSP